MENFRVVKIQVFAGHNFECVLNCETCIRWGKKCEKRRKCWLTSILSGPQFFSMLFPKSLSCTTDLSNSPL